MKFALSIKCSGSAFGDEGDDGYDRKREVARILHDLADRIETDLVDESVLLDYNGNTVGKAGFVMEGGAIKQGYLDEDPEEEDLHE